MKTNNDAQNWISDIKSEFSKTDDDELFIRKYSDIFNPFVYVSAEDISENVSSLMESAVGTIVGPFKLNQNTLRLAKLDKERQDLILLRLDIFCFQHQTLML